MKPIFLLIVTLTIFFASAARAERGALLPPQPGQVLTRDASSTNIPTTYTTGAAMGTSVSKKSHIKVINATSTDIAVSFSGTATNCGSASDNDVVPANSSSVDDFIFVNSNVCIRSLGSAISSGKVYIVLW